MSNRTRHEDISVLWNEMASQGREEAMKSEEPFSHHIVWDLNKILIMVVTMVTLIFGVAGNVMILLTVVIRRLMHNPISYYMVNLAVVHTILSLVVCPFLTFPLLRDTSLERGACAVFFMLLYSLALLLVLSVFTIAVDRLWKGRWNWHYLSHQSGALAAATLTVSWLAAAALTSALELTGVAQHPLRTVLCQPRGPVGRAAGAAQPGAQGDVAVEVVFFLCYGLAFFCLVFVQIIYGYKSRLYGHLPGSMAGDTLLQVPAAPRKKDAVEEFDEAKAAQARLAQLNKRLFEDGDQEARSIRMLSLLFSLHTICWLPFYMVYSMNVHMTPDFVPLHIVEIVHYVAFLSSPLNVVLYYFFSVEFNLMIRNLLKTMCCRFSSLSSGSSLTLDLERLQGLSDDEVKMFSSLNADRFGGPTHSEISVDIRPATSDAGVNVSGEDVSMSGELREIEESQGPAAALDDWKKWPRGHRRRRRRRRRGNSKSKSPTPPAERSEAAPMRVESLDDEPKPSESRTGSSARASGSSTRRGRGSSLRGDGSSAERVLSPRDRASRSHWGSDLEPEPAPAAERPASSLSNRSGSVGVAGGRGSAGRPHGLISSLFSMFRRGRGHDDGPSSGQPTDAPPPAASATDADSPPLPARRSFASRVAALFRRRVAPSAGRHRTASEASLVRRLVRTGLPAGVEATQDSRLAGVWRSPSGTPHKLDPDDDAYPRLLERIADTNSGYRSPTGQRIHHVCAAHHVHQRCHHHDWRRGATPTPAPRRQTSVGNWIGGRGPVTTRRGADRAAEQLGPLMSVHEAELGGPRRPPRGTSASSADSDYQDEVKRVTDL